MFLSLKPPFCRNKVENNNNIYKNIKKAGTRLPIRDGRGFRLGCDSIWLSETRDSSRRGHTCSGEPEGITTLIHAAGRATRVAKGHTVFLNLDLFLIPSEKVCKKKYVTFM
jgi:hypothetical protein